MRRIEQPYLKVQHPELNNGNHMVLQTYGMKLLGGVRFFNPDIKGERAKRGFLANHDNPYYWAKANGYRVFVTLYHGLRSIHPEEMEERKEEIHEILQEMAQFYANQMTDGMRKHYADKDVTLPED